jgi:hypothetical protein
VTGESLTKARWRPERASSRRITSSPAPARARPLRGRPPRPARRDLEHGLDRGRLGVGADDVGLGAGSADQEDRVEEHRLAGAGLTSEHVEPGPERRRDGVDHGEVANADFEEHLSRC